MSTYQIKSNESFSIDATVRESDKYTQAAYLKFELNYHPEKIRGTHEMFMTPVQLIGMGHFLIEQGRAIEAEQKARNDRT